MQEFDDGFEVPVDVPEQPTMPLVTANEQAFYASEANETPEAQEGVRFDLERNGSNPIHKAASDSWTQEQQTTDDSILLDSISDSTLTVHERKQLFDLHTNTTFKSTNLRDKYIMDNASTDVNPVDRKDEPVRIQDIEAQDLYINTVEARKEAHTELQRMQAEWTSNLDSSVGSVLGGLVGDFAPFALPNFRNAAAADKAGLGLNVSNSSNGLADDIINGMSGFLATGSLNRKVADAFRDSPPEQQQQILRDVIAGLDSVPGTDFNKFLAMQELIEQPLDSNIGTAGMNVLGVLSALPLGQLITNPIKFVRWFTSFDNDLRAAKTVVGTDADIIGRGTPSQFGSGVVPNATVTTDAAGNKSVPLNTFLPNHNSIIPKAKPINNPTASDNVITMNDKMVKEKFPARHPDIQTTFATPSSGYAKGNLTDIPVGVDDSAEVITQARVVEDFVEGQNYGQQQAARELLELAKSVPTAKNEQVLVDDLWQAAGGNDVISLDEFKGILKDLDSKGSINLVKSVDKLEDAKGRSASIINGKDVEVNAISFAPPKKRTITDDAIIKTDEFGDNLTATAQIEKILAKGTRIPEEIIARVYSKTYSSSFVDKQAGMNLVRVESSLFDKLFSASKEYVGAGGAGGSSKKYNEFSKFFKETKNIEVGSVEVAADGTIKFIDGKHRYAVLRDNGIREIPLSMSRQSIINAQNNGFLNGIAKETPTRPIQGELTTIARSVVPDVPANSPAGSLSVANPVAAANRGVAIIQDTTDVLGKKMGTSRAEVYGSWALPKMQKAVEEQFPDVANLLRKVDNIAKKGFDDSVIDVNITPHKVVQREISLIVDSLRSIKGPAYQQSNSTLDFGTSGAHGIAQYGANSNYGFSSVDEAADAYDKVKNANPNFPTRIVQKGDQYFVEQEWERNFNHVDRFMFDEHSLDANFLGIDVSAIARTRLGDHLIPFSMSDKEGMVKTGGALLNEIKANKIELEFIQVIQKVVLDRGMPMRELNSELRKVQESQKWSTLGELSQANAHLSKKKFEKLVQGYEGYKRLSDYNYLWINRIDRENANKVGHKGIYNKDGQMVGQATENFKPSLLAQQKEVWSYELDRGIPKPREDEGVTVLLARHPIKNGNGDIFPFVTVTGSYEKGLLPSRTLPRVEGWVARKNVENWYVDVIPSTATIGGNVIDSSTEAGRVALREHTRTVGAGMTKPEVEKLIAKMKKEPEFTNANIMSRKSKENEANSVDDYSFYAKTVSNSKKRGERLPTLNGLSTLADPVEALASVQRSAVNLQVWQPYQEAYKKSWVAKFGRFSKGQYPTHPSQIVPDVGAMTALEQKEFKIAQRLESYLRELNKFSTFGDDVWSNGFHGMADVLENIKVGGAQAAEFSRDIARQGNLAVRLPKSIATALFISGNPMRQWMVQPQQLLELNAILPEYRKQSFLDIPAIINALYSRNELMDVVGNKALYNSAATMSGMKRAEFDEVVEAFYSTGLPQAVDLNSVLLGGLFEGKFNIDPSVKQKAIKALATVVQAPGSIGKSIGFGPAELANLTGTWLFTRQRFIKDNPGVNWNTPDNLATISKQTWDISHSMLGRAGSSPWQKGALGTVLQFATVQHRGIMQPLMSKTLTKEERVKITAARLALYGVHGIPLAGVALGAAVNEFGSKEVQEIYPKAAGGLADAGTNALIDLWLQDPDAPSSDFIFSKALTPMPETHPFLDLFIEGKRLMFQEGGAPNPRFPGLLAIGGLYEAMADVNDIYTIQPLDTIEKLYKWVPEVAEMYSGYNNYAKARALKNIEDKTNKRGQNVGLELNNAAAYAQLFGFTSRQEADGYLINNILFESKKFIDDAAKDIVDSLTKANNKFDLADYHERKRRIGILMSGISDDPSEIRAIKDKVDQIQLTDAKKGSFRDTIYYNLYKHYGDRNNAGMQEMLNILRGSSHPGDQKILEQFDDMMATTIPGEDLDIHNILTNKFKGSK